MIVDDIAATVELEATMSSLSSVVMIVENIESSLMSKKAALIVKVFEVFEVFVKHMCLMVSSMIVERMVGAVV
jgi:hypothetical protein